MCSRRPRTQRLAQLELDFEAMIFGQPRPTEVFELDPERFFMTDPALDFALVAVKPRSRVGTPLQGYGFKPLIGEQGKILVSQSVNIVQHPDGRPKEVVIRNNQLIDLFDDQDDVPFCHYLADTEQGSSGSPVYNDQWEIVALHHQAVPQTNAKGELVDAAGVVIREGRRSRPDHLDRERGHPRLAAGRAYRREPAARPGDGADPRRAAGALARERPPRRRSWRPSTTVAASSPPGTSARRRARDPLPGAVAGSVTFTVPLRITVDLGPAVTGRNDAGGR